MRPLILVSNDDSYTAPGVHALIDRLVNFGDVVAVCPLYPQSGQSMAITVSSPLRINRLPDYNGAKMYNVSGSPVDCVKLAMHHILDRRPDLVVTGINHGSNSGNSIIYSGTMGAVLEGCMLGIPSIRYSFHSHDQKRDISACRHVVETITSRVIEHGLPHGTCLNVNVPKCEAVCGIKVVRAARGYWTEEYAEYIDPHGQPFYWLTGKFHNEEPGNPETDLYWTDRGYASVVPCHPDQSATDMITTIEHLLD